MNNIETLSTASKALRLYNLSKSVGRILMEAQQEKPSYSEFLKGILTMELEGREKRDFERRLSAACLPARHDLEQFDFNYSCGITKSQMKELRSLSWIEQTYNIILMGPSGTGKTFIAAGLVYEAVKNGHKAYLMTMENIVTCLKMKELSPSAMTTYRKILNADLLAIDDIMLLPVSREEATAFFNLINTLHEKTSVIITTNKSPTEWAKDMNDEVLTTALLDRLLYHCEVIKLDGNSYRMENRKTIFEKKKEV